MAFDPSKIIVGSAGFVQDWLLSREWKRILIAAVPVYLGIAVLGVVFGASRSSKDSLAQWYLDLGNEEIAEWENAWAPAVEGDDESDSDAGDEPADETQQSAEEGERPKVSPYAEILFQRVQMLKPGDRSQYVIGELLAQQGAVGQAEQLLTSISPNEGAAGYAPGHFSLAKLYTQRIRENPAKYKPLILHHLTQAARWNRMPLESLTGAAQLFATEGSAFANAGERAQEQGKAVEAGNFEALAAKNFMQAANFQAMAAEREPANYIGLAKLARVMENPKLEERAIRTAEEHLTRKLEEDSQDLERRLQLATLYGYLKKTDEVRKLLFDGVTVELTPEFKREQSQFYVQRFRESFEQKDGKAEIKIGLLDVALQLDPSNPAIAEQVAVLVRMGATSPKGDLLDSLRTMLATGQATVTTHALIAETHLARGDMKAAIPHLEQVVVRAGTQTQYLNNLAYCLAKLQPERIEEAVQLASRAIATDNAKVNGVMVQPAVKAEYFETYSMVLDMAGRSAEAIAAIESAISLAPRPNPIYHEAAAKLYRKASDEAMAEVHDRLADEARANLEAQQENTQP